VDVDKVALGPTVMHSGRLHQSECLDVGDWNPQVANRQKFGTSGHLRVADEAGFEIVADTTADASSA
jgi:hypothetical protein